MIRKTERAHKLTRLAEAEGLAVDLCPCGTLAVHIGAVSLRLHPESVASLREVLDAATAKRELLLGRAPEQTDDAPLQWAALAARALRGKA